MAAHKPAGDVDGQEAKTGIVAAALAALGVPEAEVAADPVDRAAALLDIVSAAPEVTGETLQAVHSATHLVAADVWAAVTARASEKAPRAEVAAAVAPAPAALARVLARALAAAVAADVPGAAAAVSRLGAPALKSVLAPSPRVEASPDAASTGPGSFVLRNVVALLGESMEPRLCDSIEVRDGIIVRIDAGRIVRDITQVETRLVLMPGMWNGHTHIGDACLPDGASGMTLAETFFRPDGYKYRMLAATSEEELVASMKDTLRAMAAAGVVGHLDFREQGAAGAAMLRRASEATGVASVILSQLPESPFTADELLRNSSSLPGSAAANLEAMLAVADGFSESTMNDLTDPAWRAVVDATASRGKLRAIHCLENEQYRTDSLRMAGCGDLARAIDVYRADLVIHMTVATDAEIRAAADAGLSVCVNPRANMALGLPVPPVGPLLAASSGSDLRLLLGTDNGMLNAGSLFAEMDAAYRIATAQLRDPAGASPADILRMVTVNPARLLARFGHGDLTGTIEAGSPADLVLLNFDALHLRRSRNIPASIVTRAHPGDVIGVWRRGRELLSH